MNLLKIMSLSLFFTLCLIGITTTFAQYRATNLTEEQKEAIKKNLEAYTAALHLSEAQKPKFEEITKKYAKQMIAVKESGGRRMSKYKKVKSIRKTHSRRDLQSRRIYILKTKASICNAISFHKYHFSTSYSFTIVCLENFS